MGKELSNDYYDRVYNKSLLRKGKYSLDVSGEDSPYNKLFFSCIECLNLDDEIIEIGCGTGQLAELLINNKFNYVLGFDFSKEAIDISKKRCIANTNKFKNININDFDFNSIDYNCVVSLEVFEHINNDIDIIQLIPKNSKVVFSVPNFDDPAHVRYFENEEEVIDRYSKLFSEFNIKTIGKDLSNPKRSKRYLVCAIKN